MTPGEIARWANAERGLGCDLAVVPMEIAGTARPAPRERIGEAPAWVLPSPNMPTRETALVYPGLCLLEGTNLSEARGTTRPFELVGAPWLDAEKAADRANALGLPGVAFRPHVFRPTFHKHAGQDCGGVQLHVTDEGAFRPFETGLRLVKLLRDLDPSHFRWRTESVRIPRRRPGDRPPGRDVRSTASSSTRASRSTPWLATFAADVARFAPERDRALLYSTGGHAPAAPGRRRARVGKDQRRRGARRGAVSSGLRVGTVKHSGHPYETDVPGKDSQRHAAAGADPAVLVAGRADRRPRANESPTRRSTSSCSAEMAGVDVVLVEGFRARPGPKVEVVRAATGREPLAVADADVVAVVTDRPTGAPAAVPRLALERHRSGSSRARARPGPRGSYREGDPRPGARGPRGARLRRGADARPAREGEVARPRPRHRRQPRRPPAGGGKYPPPPGDSDDPRPRGGRRGGGDGRARLLPPSPAAATPRGSRSRAGC